MPGSFAANLAQLCHVGRSQVISWVRVTEQWHSICQFPDVSTGISWQGGTGSRMLAGTSCRYRNGLSEPQMRLTCWICKQERHQIQASGAPWCKRRHDQEVTSLTTSSSLQISANHVIGSRVCCKTLPQRMSNFNKNTVIDGPRVCVGRSVPGWWVFAVSCEDEKYIKYTKNQ